MLLIAQQFCKTLIFWITKYSALTWTLLSPTSMTSQADLLWRHKSDLAFLLQLDWQIVVLSKKAADVGADADADADADVEADVAMATPMPTPTPTWKPTLRCGSPTRFLASNRGQNGGVTFSRVQCHPINNFRLELGLCRGLKFPKGSS